MGKNIALISSGFNRSRFSDGTQYFQLKDVLILQYEGIAITNK